jgi:hypothetical protein
VFTFSAALGAEYHFLVSCLFMKYLWKFFKTSWPPLWSGGRNSWIQIQRSGFDSRRYQIFWEVVGVERGPLSLVSTTEELLERKSSSCCQEIWEYSHRDLSRWPRGTLCPQKLALTSSTGGGCSVGIVCSRTQATEFIKFLKKFSVDKNLSP